MRIVTVLRSGGDFKPEHVDRLREQCAEYAPGVEFVCLTDLTGKKLLNDFPGWWSKVEIFRLHGPVLYFDLDTTIVGDLTPILDAVESHRFLVLRDFGGKREVQSSVMGWNGNLYHIYRAFLSDPEHWMRRFSTSKEWGDQGFIEWIDKGRECWQDVCPGMFCSYKWHVAKGKKPDDCRVIVYHGRPRPWDA